MFFRYVFMNSGLCRLHSTDLSDLQAAILNDDDDGPDGGSPSARARPAHSRKTLADT